MIFLVEDHASIRETLVAYLQVAGYQILEFEKASGLIDAVPIYLPELIIFDVLLPDGNGFLLAKQIRQKYFTIPFLFLTARDSESDRITGLELGAEDYIVKPFSPREVVLRVNLIISRNLKTVKQNKNQLPSLWFCESSQLEISIDLLNIYIDKKLINLTLSEWNILLQLIKKSPGIVTRSILLTEVLQYVHTGSEHTIHTHITNLRSKLGPAQWIETVRGFGYRFMGVHE